MTSLSRPIVRKCQKEVFDGGRRAVVITLRPPDTIELRTSGRSRRYYLSAATLYWQAVAAELATAKRRRSVAGARRARTALRRRAKA